MNVPELIVKSLSLQKWVPLSQVVGKFREIDPDVWVKLLNQRTIDLERYAGPSDQWSAVICDDDRFPNEAKALKDAGWIMIRLDVSEKEQQRRLESLRNRNRRDLFDKQDEVDERREVLIDTLEDKLTKKTEIETLFAIRWYIK